MKPEEARALVLDVSGRSEIDDALDWIARGWHLETGLPVQTLLRAITSLEFDSESKNRALQYLSRIAATSDFDSAAVLFGLNLVSPPAKYRKALDELAFFSPTKTLAGLTASSVIAARRTNPFVLDVLCEVAGVSYRDLCERVDGLPTSIEAEWKPSQVRAAFAEIDSVVGGLGTPAIPDADALCSIDLMPRFRDEHSTGWELVEEQRKYGVPYEFLLAQRAVGGAWLAHRNRTASRVSESAAEALAEQLDSHGIVYLRSRDVGGMDLGRQLADLANSSKQVGMLVLDGSAQPCYGIVFASARDGGTARKSIGSLAQMEQGDRVRMAVMLTGPGWRQRNETALLAEVFNGRVFTDMSLSHLVADIRATIDASPKGGQHASDG